jgi:hypothetical protein
MACGPVFTMRSLSSALRYRHRQEGAAGHRPRGRGCRDGHARRHSRDRRHGDAVCHQASGRPSHQHGPARGGRGHRVRPARPRGFRIQAGWLVRGTWRRWQCGPEARGRWHCGPEARGGRYRGPGARRARWRCGLAQAAGAEPDDRVLAGRTAGRAQGCPRARHRGVPRRIAVPWRIGVPRRIGVPWGPVGPGTGQVPPAGAARGPGRGAARPASSPARSAACPARSPASPARRAAGTRLSAGDTLPDAERRRPRRCAATAGRRPADAPAPAPAPGSHAASRPDAAQGPRLPGAVRTGPGIRDRAVSGRSWPRRAARTPAGPRGTARTPEAPRTPRDRWPVPRAVRRRVRAGYPRHRRPAPPARARAGARRRGTWRPGGRRSRGGVRLPGPGAGRRGQGP